jgi:hypothetical protein
MHAIKIIVKCIYVGSCVVWLKPKQPKKSHPHAQKQERNALQMSVIAHEMKDRRHSDAVATGTGRAD